MHVRPPQKIIMRIYRDIRFSKDKRPYKTHVSAWWVRDGLQKTSGAGFYFSVNPEEVVIAAGVYMPEREQLLAIRRYLADHHAEFRAVMKAKNFDDAMRIANNVPFGLSASIQTTNLSRVFEYIHRMEAGLLTVNLPSAGVEYQLPFGGTKDSSFGPKEQGQTALEFYSDFKTVYLKY